MAGRQVKQLVGVIQEYIKVRKLIRLTNDELSLRDALRQQAEAKAEQDKLIKQQKRNGAIAKLGLTQEEVEALLGK
jgi:hypothetical protein